MVLVEVDVVVVVFTVVDVVVVLVVDVVEEEVVEVVVADVDVTGTVEDVTSDGFEILTVVVGAAASDPVSLTPPTSTTSTFFPPEPSMQPQIRARAKTVKIPFMHTH